ncbi:MAG: hypothetical protein ALAOOOJD_03962 [bacterium]|nr:hypothetical protein [bacterium]
MFEIKTIETPNLLARSRLTSADVATSTERLDDYQIELCDTEENFRRLQSEWNDLLDHSARPSVFLKHQWMHTWWLLYGSRRTTSQLFILTTRDAENQLVGVLPLYLERWGRQPLTLRVLRLLGTTDQAPEYLDAIVHQRNSQHILAALLANLAVRRHEYDALQFTDLSREALLPTFLSGWSQTLGGVYQNSLGSICPYLKTVGDFDAFIQSLSTKHRYNFRRETRRLIEQRHAVFEVAVTPEAVQNGLEALFALHHQHWAAKEGKSQFDNQGSHTFHRQLAVALAEEGAVRLYRLNCEGHAIAIFYCFCYNQQLFYYQAGLDPAFKNYSLGAVVIGKMIADCFAENFREFDFLRGKESYKFNWTSLTRPTFICEIALSAPAKLYFCFRHFYRELKKRIRSLQAQLSLQKTK